MSPTTDIHSLKSKHPNFKGNWDDLIAFEKLTNSEIRSADREQALSEWTAYKTKRQWEHYLTKEEPHNPTSGTIMTKGGHLKALHKRVVDLSGATIDNAILGYADFRAVIFKHASMRGVWMKGADFQDADLSNVIMSESEDGRDTRLMNGNFDFAILDDATITNTDLTGASFKSTSAIGTNFKGSNLSNTRMVGTNLSKANLTGTRVYGIAAWDVNKTDSIQKNLLIESGRDTVTVDDLDIAQFIYLLLENSKISSAISTIGRKAVLILGRFTPERKDILDAIRDKIRDEYNLLPIVFDFERAVEKDFTETIKVLAGLSRFVIADISEPKSSPLELQATIPNYMVPFVIIHQSHERPFSMFTDLWKKYDKWVLKPVHYESKEELIEHFEKAVMERAFKKESELMETKLKDKIESRSIKDLP